MASVSPWSVSALGGNGIRRTSDTSPPSVSPSTQDAEPSAGLGVTVDVVRATLRGQCERSSGEAARGRMSVESCATWDALPVCDGAPWAAPAAWMSAGRRAAMPTCGSRHFR